MTEQSAAIVHPFTGEIVEDNLAVLELAETAADQTLRAIGPLYDFRKALRERIAELRGPAELPKPRWRSDKQARVAACPRCGKEPA